MSTIKVDTLDTRTGTGNITVSRPLTGLSGSGASLTALNATQLTSGTVPDARFPSTLPAIDGSSLTNLPAHTGNVAFPATQVASADANTLDDYEEGTWTPVIGGLSGESGQSYANQNGTYTKIGRMVHVNCSVSLSAKGTISGLAILKGLPFTVLNSSSQRGTGSCGDWGNLASSLVYCTVYASETRTYGYIRGTTSGTATLSGLTTSAINNNSYFYFSMSYMT